MKSIILKLTINFSHSDVNEESQIIGPDKIITFKKNAHQTSMKSITSNFTIYFSYSDENGDHKSFFETKSSHLRKTTTVRRDLKEVYHSKLTINFSHSDVNEESQIIGPDKIITFKKNNCSSNVNEVYHFKFHDVVFIFRWKWGS